ncbi:MAG: YgiQ family radical SAM protein [Campylobacterales bacterium]|nr:YgiQ family radical SAM protein [Campylobacterales bacterium]
MFLPTTKEELQKLNWTKLDVILVTGDTYIDSPYIGVAIVGKMLLNAGFKVGIIAQPDINSEVDITRLGEPSLFWGVSGGSVDSMVANYTAVNKKRKSDDFTPTGINNKRPDRAIIAYSNLIRKYFKNTAPIVLGGIEASLRRISHYDFWSNSIRKPLIFDAKADILFYGLAENNLIELANKLKNGEDFRDVRGVCYISKEKNEEFLDLPSFEECKSDKQKYIDSYNIFYKNNDPLTAKGLNQQIDSRFLIQNPPAFYNFDKNLDKIYDLEYERDVHPYYKKFGDVKAVETIRFSITTHVGCYGECNFCAIALHQGRTIRSRTETSIMNEAKKIISLKDFKGYILDVGGATANMYGFECDKKLKSGVCEEKKCVGISLCKALKPNHERQIKLLKELRTLNGVKKVFVNSGIRYDLINEDKTFGDEYLEEIVKHHISGQMKIAPEHTDDTVLALMNKPSKKVLIEFKTKFDNLNKKFNKKQFLTYYFIAAHPGCSEKEMKNLKEFATQELKITPEQTQIFTPTPSTYSTLMYYTKTDPFTKKAIFVESDLNKKEKQKEILLTKTQQKNFKK